MLGSFLLADARLAKVMANRKKSVLFSFIEYAIEELYANGQREPRTFGGKRKMN